MSIGGVIGALAVTVLSGAALSAEPEGNKYAKPRLIAETTAAQPGQTLNLAVTFEITHDWHLYWKGQSDTGMPIDLSVTLPPGYEAGEVRWPAPERSVLPGDLIDYTYHDRVTLIVPVKVPTSASGTIDSSAHVSFLVCEHACIPGKADMKLSVPVAKSGTDAVPSPDAKLFAEARRNWPRPLAEVGTAVKVTLTQAGKDHVLTINAPDADRLAFMPEDGAAVLQNAFTDGQKDGQELVLTFEPGSDESLGHRIKGVLMRRQPGGVIDFLQIDQPLAAAASPGQPAKDTGTHGK